MTQEQSSEQILSHAGPPDWETLEEELLCPLCEYNLRGISEPRCPECGYRFAWKELQDAQRLGHPYLFEQQDRHRVAAIWKTAVGGLLPGRFWRTLKPTQRPNVGRLWFYFTIVMVICLGGEIPVLYRIDWPSQVDSYWPLERLAIGPLLIFATLYWPFASIAALMIFRISMRMAKLRPIHALRCVIYSADGVLWLGLILLFWEGDDLLFTYYFHLPGYGGPHYIALLILAGILPLFVYRLCRAYQLYLRFDHAIATVLSTQFIVALALVTIVVCYLNLPPF